MSATHETTESVSCCARETTEGSAISHCPMAAKFDKTFGSAKLKLSLCVIGAALIILGVVIILEPQIIVWLMAFVSILMGIALLMLAYSINRMKPSPHEQNEA